MSLEDLALVAGAAGFRRLAADTLPGNMAMLGVFRVVGLVHRHWFEGGIVCVQLDLTDDHLLQDHADLRDGVPPCGRCAQSSRRCTS